MGPREQLVRAAAESYQAPADLMLAVASVEGGLDLASQRTAEPDEEVPVAGALELRHGLLNTLALGAQLLGQPETALVSDYTLGTQASAAVLAQLGASTGASLTELASWSAAIEQLSGHATVEQREEYRSRVFQVLLTGHVVTTRDGESISIPAHPEIPVALTIAPVPSRPLDTPEYPGAIWFTTPSTNKWTPGRSGLAVQWVAIHDTEGGWDASVATLQNDPNKSVHYIVDADGSRVGQFVHETDTAWHVGNWYYNQRSIGIEHVGMAANNAYQTPMYVKSADLVNSIASRQTFTSPLDRSVIIGHQEVPDGSVIPESSAPCTDPPSTCLMGNQWGGASNHRDPGIYWNWCQYMQIVGNGASCKCNDANSLYNCSLDGTERIRCQSNQVQIDMCPNGCSVQPNGVDDVCVSTPTPPGGTGGAAGMGGSSSAGGSPSSGGTSSGNGGSTSASGGSSSGNGGSSGGNGGSSGGHAGSPSNQGGTSSGNGASSSGATSSAGGNGSQVAEGAGGALNGAGYSTGGSVTEVCPPNSVCAYNGSPSASSEGMCSAATGSRSTAPWWALSLVGVAGVFVRRRGQIKRAPRQDGWPRG